MCDIRRSRRWGVSLKVALSFGGHQQRRKEDNLKWRKGRGRRGALIRDKLPFSPPKGKERGKKNRRRRRISAGDFDYPWSERKVDGDRGSSATANHLRVVISIHRITSEWKTDSVPFPP